MNSTSGWGWLLITLLSSTNLFAGAKWLMNRRKANEKADADTAKVYADVAQVLTVTAGLSVDRMQEEIGELKKDNRSLRDVNMTQAQLIDEQSQRIERLEAELTRWRKAEH